MFLVERAIGIGIYMVLLLFTCLLLVNTNMRSKPILKFYLLCLCVMAFCYKPYVTADLHRIYLIVEAFKDMELSQFIMAHVMSSSIPVANILYRVIGKIGIHSLLPAFSALVSFSLIFYTITTTEQIYSISKKNVAYVLFFVMTTSIFISAIGGIRMMLAISIIAFCFFRETVEKKFNMLNIILYAVAAFTHAIGLVVIAMRFTAIIFDTSKSFARRFFYFIILAGVGAVFAFNFSNIIEDLFEKIGEYLFGDMYSDMWEYLMGGLILILLITLLCNYWPLRKDADCRKLRVYNAGIVASIVCATLFCWEFSIFYRFVGHLAVIFSIPMMLVTLERTNGRACRIFKIIDFRSVLMILSAAIAVISCLRGSLSSLKFFEL